MINIEIVLVSLITMSARWENSMAIIPKSLAIQTMYLILLMFKILQETIDHHWLALTQANLLTTLN